MTPPTDATATGLKEAIARVIDPVAFGDRYVGNRAMLKGPGIYERRAGKQAVALAKAASILALLRSASVETVVVPRIATRAMVDAADACSDAYSAWNAMVEASNVR